MSSMFSHSTTVGAIVLLAGAAQGVGSIVQHAAAMRVHEFRPAQARPTPRPAVVDFQYAMYNGPIENNAGVIASGQVTERMGGHTNVERRCFLGANSVDLSFSSESVYDGTVLLRVDWRERTASGDEIRWRPTIRLRRGADTVARMGFGAGGQERLLRVHGL